MNNIYNDLIDELNEVIIKMDRALYIYRSNAKLTKELNVELPLAFKNKIAGLAAMANICEKVAEYFTLKNDVLFGEWETQKDEPNIDEIRLAINLITQYRALRREGCADDYFIPNELKGWYIWQEKKQ